jgi:hypothetical protein
VSRTIRTARGLGVAVAVSAGLVCSAAGVAVSAPHGHHHLAPTPHLRATIKNHHFVLRGPTTFAAGRVDLTLKAVGGDHTIQVASFKKGYTFRDLRADLTAFGESQGPGGNIKAGLKHLNNAVRHAHLYGGLDADNGTIRGSVVLPKAGTYVVYNDSGNLPVQPQWLTVTGPAVKRANPNSSATVVATSAKRFAGAKTLPARGTITFKNASTNSPHMLILQHVTTGTTRKQVLQWLQSGPQGNPSFGLQGSANTDIVGEGTAQTLTYRLPKGEYIELCFFPDLKTGMPHALMGMVGVVTVK